MHDCSAARCYSVNAFAVGAMVYVDSIECVLGDFGTLQDFLCFEEEAGVVVASTCEKFAVYRLR